MIYKISFWTELPPALEEASSVLFHGDVTDVTFVTCNLSFFFFLVCPKDYKGHWKTLHKDLESNKDFPLFQIKITGFRKTYILVQF